MLEPFDWASCDVVRYCWPMFESCGSAGEWFGGLGAFVAAAVAVGLARAADRSALRKSRQVAAAIFFEECYSVAARALNTLEAERVLPNSYVSEIETLQAHRHRVVDLPPDCVHHAQRLISKIRSINVAVSAVLEIPERRARIAAIPREQRDALIGVKVSVPDMGTLADQFASCCSLAIWLAKQLAEHAGAVIPSDLESLAKAEAKLAEVTGRQSAAAEAPGTVPGT